MSTVYKDATAILELAQARKLRITTAESCTGGLVAAMLTEIPGSSDVFERGFITYSNQAKVEMLGVDASLIEAHGAVSEVVARAMAVGALAHSHAELSVSITGIAGPGGGSLEKPVGTVHIASAFKGRATLHQSFTFASDSSRQSIREQSVSAALTLLHLRLSEEN